VVSDEELRSIVESGKLHSSAAIGEDQNILWNVVDPSTQIEGPGGDNHSCDPNLWFADELTLVARRDIAAGEELTIDYALGTVDPAWRLICHCGSPLCRKLITGDDWKLPELQKKYAGHFSPFINERIRKRAVFAK
jgi:hypothetical protein